MASRKISTMTKSNVEGADLKQRKLTTGGMASAVDAMSVMSKMSKRRKSTHYKMPADDAMSVGSELKLSNVTLANTYRLEPDRCFPYYEVEAIITDVLRKQLAGKEYAAELCGKLAVSVSAEVTNCVKMLGIQRYRIVTVTNFTEKRDQTLKVASRCLWNTECDTSASIKLTVNDIIATCTVYMVYVE